METNLHFFLDTFLKFSFFFEWLSMIMISVIIKKISFKSSSTVFLLLSSISTFSFIISVTIVKCWSRLKFLVKKFLKIWRKFQTWFRHIACSFTFWVFFWLRLWHLSLKTSSYSICVSALLKPASISSCVKPKFRKFATLAPGLTILSEFHHKRVFSTSDLTINHVSIKINHGDTRWCIKIVFGFDMRNIEHWNVSVFH